MSLSFHQFSVPDGDEVLKNWSEHAWTINDAFYKKYGVVQQQIESFDAFLKSEVGQIIDSLPEIEIKDDEGVRHSFKFMGKSVVIEKPKLIEADGCVREVYPTEARLRNATYASRIFVPVKWTTKSRVEIQKVVSKSSDKLNHIATLPIMVRSSCCNLSKAQGVQKMNECPLDPGGYFIINGKERVIVAQERAANNTAFVFKGGSGTKTKYECEIRSSIENTSAAAHAFWVNLEESKSNRKSVKLVRNRIQSVLPGFRIKAKFPSLTKNIEIRLLFQALGFPDKEIYQNIVEEDVEHPGEVAIQLLALLGKSMRTRLLPSMMHARDYIGNLARDQDMDEDERLHFVEHLFQKEFLPHIGTSEQDKMKKCYYVCFMIRRLLLVYSGLRQPDDRDHLQNKRFIYSGPLMAQLFHRSLRGMQNDMKKTFEIQIRTRKPIDVKLAIVPGTVTRGMNKALAMGSWGDSLRMTSRIYTGVTQELNRLNLAAEISSLRRVSSPEDKLHLMVKPRLLANTHWGMLCPSETPEGKSVGLVKHLALQTIVTVGTPSRPVVDFLVKQCGVEAFSVVMEGKQLPTKRTKVFVNGDWVGFHDRPDILINYLLENRRYHDDIDGQTSISRDYCEREIYIETDSGRPCRPLMILSQKKLAISLDDLSDLKNDDNGWDTLMSKGLVELLDTRESENCLVAMNPSILYPKKHNEISRTYSHMEIHPSLILGSCAAVIPFINHNQSPRNVYQSAIGKQAMGIYATNFNTRMDTAGHLLFYPQKPLVKTAASKYVGFSELPAGINTVAAIGSYGGYNQEDAILMSRGSIDRGFFRSMYHHTYSDKAEKSSGQLEEFGIPNPLKTRGLLPNTARFNPLEKFSCLEEDGLPTPGTVINAGDVVIGKIGKISQNELRNSQSQLEQHRSLEDGFQDPFDCNRKGFRDREYKPPVMVDKQDRSVFFRKPDRGVVSTVLLTENMDGCRMSKVQVRSMLVPKVGDKFSSMHGQKGVVGMIYNEEDLFFTSSGLIPDIVINPHGLPSRMTIGQLLESVFGKVAALDGKIQNGTPFEGFDLKEPLRKLDKAFPNSQYSSEVVYNGATGRKMSVRYFIGPTYYQRLKHLVDEKVHSRARGAVVSLTRQPVQGFSRDGGLRFGEMERDCVISTGSSAFLMERTLHVSDSYHMTVCANCGLMVSSRPRHSPSHPYFKCMGCSRIESSHTVNHVRVPYAAKLLFQELMCMNIAPRIMPDACNEEPN